MGDPTEPAAPGSTPWIARAGVRAFAQGCADVVISFLQAEDEHGKVAARLVEEAGRRAVLGFYRPDATGACRALIDITTGESDEPTSW